jgi:hypothetical protein
MKRENISRLFKEEKNKLDKEEKQKVMKDIELKTTKKIISGFKTGEIINPITEKDPVKLETVEKKFQSILSGATNEFQEKMGRNPTYSEMREMFG